jgi:hypothetical protein
MVRGPISTQDVYAAEWLSHCPSESLILVDNVYGPMVHGYGNVPVVFFL